MATDARGHTVPAATDAPARGALTALSLSIKDILYVTSVSDRATKVAALSPSTSNPIYSHRLDAPTGSNLEVTTDGTTWYSVRPSRVKGAVVVDIGPTSGTTQLVIATAPAITVDGSTEIKIEFSWYNILLTVAADTFNVTLYDGTTPGAGTLLASALVGGGSVNTGSGFIRAFVTPSAGSHTYTARLARGSATGNATLKAAATAPAPITIE